MDNYCYIFNADIKVNRKNFESDTSILNYINIRHGYNVDDLEFVDDSSILSHNAQELISLCDSLIPPDQHNYPIACCIIEYQTQRKPYTVEAKLIPFKIIRSDNDGLHIKFFDRLQLNRGTSSTIKSLYARLNKNNTIYPYFMIHPYIELHIYEGEYKPTVTKNPLRWQSSNKFECCFCLDRAVNCLLFCDYKHICVCSNCVINLNKKCPICRSTSNFSEEIKFI